MIEKVTCCPSCRKEIKIVDILKMPKENMHIEQVSTTGEELYFLNILSVCEETKQIIQFNFKLNLVGAGLFIHENIFEKEGVLNV